MKFFVLNSAERQKVESFFSARYSLPERFWEKVVLLKRVNSVWLCSGNAAELAVSFNTKGFELQSAGILVLLELKTLKESRQAVDFFSSNILKNCAAFK